MTPERCRQPKRDSLCWPLRTGIGIADVSLNYHIRNHHNAVSEIPREVRGKSDLRTEGGSRILKVRTLVDIHTVASEMEFCQCAARKQVRVVRTYVVAISYLLVQKSYKTTGPGNRLAETRIARPNVVTLAKLVIETSTPFVLTRDVLGSIQTIKR